MIFKNFLLVLLVIALGLSFSRSFGQNEISGKVVYHNAEQTPLAGVEVMLMNLNGDLLETTLSDDFGNYSFDGLEPGSYKVTGYSDQEPPDVVDLLDVSLLIDYLNGQAEFDPMQELAANVNGSENIDVEDLEFIMENWYLYEEDFPIGGWVFEEIIVDTEGKDGGVVNGEGVCDVEDGEEVGKEPINVDYNLHNASQFTQHSIKRVSVGLNCELPIKNFYIEINYNYMKFEIEELQSELDGIEFSIDNGLIKIIWADITGNGISLNQVSNLFSINIQSIYNCQLNAEDFDISEESSFLSTKNEFVRNLDLSIEDFDFKNDYEIQFINFPNPVRTYTTFEYNIPIDGYISISILNIYGSVVKHVNIGHQKKGKNEYTFYDMKLSKGVYFTKLFVDDNMINKNSILVN